MRTYPGVKPNTYAEMIDAAVACKTKEEAQEFIHQETVQILELRPELLPEQARSIVTGNIGYMSGYLSREEAGRILDLFGTRHPYFGAIEEWPKTPEETIEMGFKVGKQAQR
jgi:hypothetical protein